MCEVKTGKLGIRLAKKFASRRANKFASWKREVIGIREVHVQRNFLKGLFIRSRLAGTGMFLMY